MKTIVKAAAVCLISGLLLCPVLSAEQGTAPYVDAYSSASDTKTTLAGAAFDAAALALQAASSDMASAAEAGAPGYQAKEGTVGHVMSTNPDGSVGISTMSQWMYIHGDGTDLLKLQLTEGQNALNLAGIDRRGTLFVPGITVDGREGRYFVHFKVVQVDILKYSDAAYEAGEFNRHYGGKSDHKRQFTLTTEVLSIEEVSSSVKLEFKMP